MALYRFLEGLNKQSFEAPIRRPLVAFLSRKHKERGMSAGLDLMLIVAHEGPALWHLVHSASLHKSSKDGFSHKCGPFFLAADAETGTETRMLLHVTA